MSSFGTGTVFKRNSTKHPLCSDGIGTVPLILIIVTTLKVASLPRWQELIVTYPRAFLQGFREHNPYLELCQPNFVCLTFLA